LEKLDPDPCKGNEKGFGTLAEGLFPASLAATKRNMAKKFIKNTGENNKF
jgi:hypothetical protein